MRARYRLVIRRQRGYRLENHQNRQTRSYALVRGHGAQVCTCTWSNLKTNQLLAFRVKTSNHHKQHSENDSEGAKGLLCSKCCALSFSEYLKKVVFEK